jgi:flagellar hook-associated protein 1 FlgK
MSLITSALQIGKSALLAYQSGLQVVSNNIANLGSEHYIRQSPVMAPLGGTFSDGGLQGGGGVTLAQIRRNVDEALNARLRSAAGDKEGATAENEGLGQLESIFDSLGDISLSSQLSDFFNAWSSLQNTPEDQGARTIVLSKGAALAESFRRTSDSLLNQYESLNKQVEDAVNQVNDLAGKLAELNGQIAAAEGGGRNTAATLCDERDALLADISQYVTIQTREQPDGSMSVYVGNDPLVQHNMVRKLTVTREVLDGRQTAVIRWADNNNQVVPWGGKLEGLITARDVHTTAQMDQLDRLALALISDVNKVHASGQGLEGYEDVTSTYEVLDHNASLNAPGSGLPYAPKNGGFLVTVTDKTTGAQTTVRIDVDLDGVGQDTTLTSLAAALDAVSHLSAQVTADHRLRITADAGQTVSVSEDGSGVLGALGLNTFFSGRDAGTIGLDANIAGRPNRVAAGASDLPGDGGNAGRIAMLASSPSESLNNGQSLLDFHTATMTQLATTTSTSRNTLDAADVIESSLQSQWESVSGVNLDEETVMLMQYQRAFQGAARVVTVVDQLIQQVLSMTS